jgi:VWFA-related protein
MAQQSRVTPFALLVAATCLVAALDASQERPTFRSGVDVVVIDVNVVDRSHTPVAGLQPRDFVVSVDGKRRKVVSAQFISHGASEASTGAKEMPGAPAPGVASSAAPSLARNILIVFDSDSMEPGDGIVARQAAEKFLGQLGSDDRVGVAALPWLRSAITMTKNRDEVQRALAGVNTGSERFRPVPYNIGLSEAFAVERGEADALTRIINRECRLSPGDPACREEVKMLVREVQVQAHLRGERSLEGLRDLGEGLRQIEGPKTVVLITGGAPPPDIRTGYAYSRIGAAFAAGQVTLYTVYIEQAQLGQVKDRLSPTYFDDQKLEMEAVANATSAAGGTFIEAVGSVDQYFERVATELSGSYLIGIEVEEKDRDGKPHRVQVEVRRRAVEVRARRQYVINPGKAIAVTPDSPAPVSAPAPPTGANRPEAPRGDDARELQALLARVVGYVAAYRQQYSGIVADEDYTQRTPTEQVRLRSDFLLVKTEADEGWVSFRDVYDVNGAPVRDRDDRLKKLFLEPSVDSARQLQEIKEESARYNLGGDVTRNVNVPLFPLLFLDSGNVPRFQFRLDGRRDARGFRTIYFEERQRPTIVRDMRASGSFLVDEVSGAVVQTKTVFTDALNQSAELAVQYTQDPKMGVWVPSAMHELYTGSTGSMMVSGTAVYSNFRRFQVTTDEKITMKKQGS